MTATRTIDLILPSGALVDRPAPDAVPAGSLYPALDSQIIYRNNDTGTAWEDWLVIADFTPGTNAEEVRDIIGGALIAGANVAVAVNDAGNTITISAVGTDPEVVRDTIGATLVAGTNITLTVDDAANTITIASAGGGGGGSGALDDLTDVAVPAPEAGQVLIFDGTDWVAGAVPGVQVSLLDQGDFDHAKSDLFDGDTLDPKWVAATSAAGLETNAVVNGGLLTLEPAASGTASTGKYGGFGIRQAAPAGSFRVEAKLLDGGGGLDDVRAGVFVASTSNSKGHINGTQVKNNRLANANGFAYSDTAEWGAYDGFDNYTGSVVPFYLWYAIEWDATTSTMRFGYSANGTFWAWYTSRGSQVQPNRIGLAMWGNQNDIRADHAMAVQWFRVVEL